MYMKGKGDAPDIIRFDESADFDIAREPTPGKMIAVDSQGNVAKQKVIKYFIINGCGWMMTTKVLT